MNNFTDKVCPFCKVKFEENDEVVVCSSCDMPHHKDCWIENQGCTTFGCMGTIKAFDGAVNSVTTTEMNFDESQSTSHIFCTKCGEKNNTDSSFCCKCGNPMRTTAAPVYRQTVTDNPNIYAHSQQNYNPTQQNCTQQNYVQRPTYPSSYQQNNYSNQGYTNNTYNQQNYYNQGGTVDTDVAAFVGSNQEYYIPKFQQLKTQNKKTSWNWSAFLFTPYWFMYRKMYAYGFATFGILFLVSIINIPFFSLLLLGGYVTIGIFANYIYMLWAEKNANQAKLINEPFKMQFIQKNGGVSSTALTLSIAGWIILSALLAVI